MIGIADKNDPQILDFAEKNKALSPVFSSGGDFKERLFRADLLLACRDNGEINGLFAFSVIPEDRYIECIAALCESSEPFFEVFDYLKERFKGFDSDWVVNPRNRAANAALSSLGATAFPPLFGYMLKSPAVFPVDPRIKPLSSEAIPEYIALHPTDVYWTAQRVIESGCFKVFAAFCDGRLAGYIDVRISEKAGFSEPFDLKVSEEHLGEGLEEALLKSAITYLKTPMFMMTEGDGAELSALKAAGFAPKPETDNVTYHIVL